MTLVQASIADSGNAVILTSDRLVTSRISRDLPSYEFEANKPKITLFGTVAIGFAGLEFHANRIVSLIKEKGNETFSGIVKTVSDYIAETRDALIAKEIKRRTGIDNPRDFFYESKLTYTL